MSWGRIVSFPAGRDTLRLSSVRSLSTTSSNRLEPALPTARELAGDALGDGLRPRGHNDRPPRLR